MKQTDPTIIEKLRVLLSIHNEFHDQIHGLHPTEDYSCLQGTAIQKLADAFEDALGYAVYEQEFNEPQPLLQKIGIFHTPKDIPSLEAYIEKLPPEQRAAGVTIMGMTWNLCAELTNTQLTPVKARPKQGWPEPSDPHSKTTITS